MTAPLRRWLAPALILAIAVTLLARPAPAGAQPGGNTAVEGGTPLLSEVLDSTGRRFLEAKAALAKSMQRQSQLAVEQRKAQAVLAELTPQVTRIASEAYRTGRLSAFSVMLNSGSPDSFLERIAALDEMNRVNDQKLKELNAARDRAVRAKLAIDAEVKRQQEHKLVMERQKKNAEKALALVGGTSLTNGFVAATSPVAAQAPRNSDGSWPAESCNQDDPTTSGCLTPRTLHAYKEVKKAGFNKFVGCYRPGGPYEHPKGRACDWSLLKSGFSPASTPEQRLYGNNLTAFLVRNADRLGILYVIWYRQIWFPATGWTSYVGDSEHTDHVHMSML